MNRYDDRARLVFHFAREEGLSLGHTTLEPEHLLLGVMREGGNASKVLGELGMTLKGLRRQVAEIVGHDGGLPKNETAALTSQARRVMDLASSEARSLGRSAIAPDHILLAIIREGDGVAYRILQQLTGDADMLRWRILVAADPEARTEAVAVTPLNKTGDDRTGQVSWAEDRLLRLERDVRQLRQELTLPKSSQQQTLDDLAPSKTLYYGVKYYADGHNRAVTERRLENLESLGFTTRFALRDLEDWGRVELEPAELMRSTLQLIDESDLVVLDLSEKGVGLGIEAGYARARAKPVITIVTKGKEISATLQGISEQAYVYDSEDGLGEFFSTLRD